MIAHTCNTHYHSSYIVYVLVVSAFKHEFIFLSYTLVIDFIVVGEPEAVLRQQLEFIYYQIIFVLTAKVHDILKSNPSKDLRELLGSDTKRLMHAVCECDITPPAVVFNSVKGFALDSAARARLLTLLTQCLAQSNAALGCIICEESLLVYSVNEEMQVTVDVKDMLLLTHFVHNSP